MALLAQPRRGPPQRLPEARAPPRREGRLTAREALAEVAVCWELAAFTGSLRVLAALTSGVGEVVRQLKPHFRASFMYVLATGSGGTAPAADDGGSAGWRWQPGTGAWEPLPPLGTHRGDVLSGNVEALVLDGRLFVLAEALRHGSRGYSLQAFDPRLWDWTVLVHIRNGEFEALLELEGQLHILGRCVARDGAWAQQLLRYAGRPGELQARPPVPTPRCYVGARALGGRLYVVGGYSADFDAVGSDRVLATAERFDPEGGAPLGAWEALPPMARPRFLCKAVAVKSCLYVLGGLNTVGSETALERFDPLVGSWSTLAPMPPGAGAAEAEECAGRILVFGGIDPTGAGNRRAGVERYDPAADRWSRLPKVGCGDAARCTALVGPPDDLMAVFTERGPSDTWLVIQRYDDRRRDQLTYGRVPTRRSRLRPLMAVGVE